VITSFFFYTIILCDFIFFCLNAVLAFLFLLILDFNPDILKLGISRLILYARLTNQTFFIRAKSKLSTEIS